MVKHRIAFAPMLLCVGCAAHNAPSAPTGSGVTYELVAVSGRHLPVDIPYGSIAGGSLRLTEGNVFVDEFLFTGAGRQSTQTSTGFFAAVAQGFELKHGDSRPAVFDTVTVVGDTLTRAPCRAPACVWPDLVYTYARR